MLGLDHFRTWDWNATSPGPIRNVFLPYLTSGIGFFTLKTMTASGLTSINSYTLQVFPRLAMAVSSLTIDYGVYVMARTLNLNVWNCLTVLASSYVTVVFNTRTFSNACECGLFALLLALIVVSRQDQLRPIQKQKEDNEDEVEEEGDGEGKKKKQSTKKKQPESKLPPKPRPPSDAFIGFWIGVFIVEGTFSRPTFPTFFLIPLVFWLTGKETSLDGKALGTIFKNVLFIMPGAVIMLIICILMDSVYYGSLDPVILDKPQLLLENLNSDFLFNNLTVTPWNFIKYNVNHVNLAAQGIHPRVTHFLVNFPMLFLPIFVCLLMEVHAVYKARSENRLTGFTASTSRAFLILTFLTPVILLSFIPHQEPRFIIPIIVPLVVLYADFIMMTNSAFPNPPWIMFNLLGCIVFGQLHQGGLVSSIDHLRQMALQPVVDNPISYHFVFFHTYMPPRHLLNLQDKILPANAKLEDEKYKHILDKSENIVTVHDLMGAGRLDMHHVVEEILSERRTPTPEPYQKEIFVISPSSLDPIFCRMNVKYNFKLKARFGPHLSMEDPPEWFPSYSCVVEPERSYNKMGFRDKLDTMFSIFVYQVEIVRMFPPETDPEKLKKLKEEKRKAREKLEAQKS